MPLMVGAKAVLKPIKAMKKMAEPVISIVFKRLISILVPSSPTSRNPTDTVIMKTRSLQMMTKRLFASIHYIVRQRADRRERVYARVYRLGLGLIGDEVCLLLTFGKLLFRVDLSDFCWSSRPDYSRSPGYSIRGEIAKRCHGHGKMGSSGPRWALSSRVLNP